MVSTDTVIGVVGAVVLAGAMVAVFYYESQNPTLDTAGAVGEGSNTYAVTWNETAMQASAAGPDVAVNAPQEHDVDIPAFTRLVTIWLNWTDTDARPEQARSGEDEFELTVTDQNGTEICAPSSNDDGSIECNWTNSSVEQPDEPDRVRGNNTAEAQSNLDEALDGSRTWTVTVRLVNTNEPLPGPLGATGQLDDSNTYRLEWRFLHWMPELEEA